MRHRDQRARVGAQHAHQAGTVAAVQVIGRFVQQEYVGIQAERLGQGRVEPLPSAQFAVRFNDLRDVSQNHVTRHRDPAAGRLTGSQQHFQQRTLAASVAPNNRDTAAVADLCCELRKTGFVRKRQTQIMDMNRFMK